MLVLARWCVGLVLLPFFALLAGVEGTPFSTEQEQTSNSTYLSVKALDAVTLTNISWSIQGRILVYFDERSTGVLRFGLENDTVSRYCWGSLALRVLKSAVHVDVTDAERYLHTRCKDKYVRKICASGADMDYYCCIACTEVSGHLTKHRALPHGCAVIDVRHVMFWQFLVQLVILELIN